MIHYRKYLVIAAQTAVSIGVLAWIASRVDLSDSMRAIAAIPPSAVILAVATVGLGFVVNALRWGALLRNFSITLSFGRLFSFYVMGLFFSLFLPTSIGGDAFRVYAVARSSDRPAAVLFATLQDRMLGLCASMAVSLAVMPLAGPMLPRDFLIWIATMQLAAVVGLAFVLYPPLAFVVGVWLSRRFSRLSGLALRMRPTRIVGHLERAMAGVGGLMRTRPGNIHITVVLGVLPVVIIAFAYQTILRSMGVDAEPAALLLIIPLVWIARLLPISLGGIGVGEGAFVLLARFAGIDGDKAFATALAVLAVQIAWALVGGVLLLRSGLKKALSHARRS